ncbi:MAG TPA: hypothetical protein VI757_02330 [Bacteroidia bacterium]|nr:hypothetical protein [Bacteroidia bacterium]
MGISKTDCRLLFYSGTVGVDFKNTLTLGRQNLYASIKDIQSCIEKYKSGKLALAQVQFTDEFCEPLFKILGAEHIDSIDYSAYQNATLIHDLNFPVPENYKNRYSCVVDGGTIEHIFNFPVAVRNCMEMLAPDGHYIGITPANNQMGHGFYQFSPELYFRIFSEDNGFRIKKMFVTLPAGDEVWYEVADPKSVKSRGTIINSYPLSLMFIAEKIAVMPVFSTAPQQSDYSFAWNTFESLEKKNVSQSGGYTKYLYRKLLPVRVRTIFRNIHDIFRKEKVDTKELGTINPEHFRKTEI